MHRKTIPIYQALEDYLYTLQYAKNINIMVQPDRYTGVRRQAAYRYMMSYKYDINLGSFWYSMINNIATYRNGIWDNSGVLPAYA